MNRVPRTLSVALGLETGRVLGLPDRHSGPCGEPVSGGGSGTPCADPYPNSAERGRADSLRRYGLAG
ncbi:snapalysin family zinc-dependent metalloprotease [Kitasatospora sp. NPDC057500]|uniref:snapalysin family zinc-dependent metalloprotease n=1 Tax=Kitasatospora sp. NPDC057500 TaxID=3346151 RepID=UPI0036B74DBE